MFWWRKRLPEDLDRELRDDLELEAADQEARGLPPDEARHAARRAFGNPTLVREEVRDLASWNAIERVWQDLRFAARMLRKTPIATAAAVLSLGLGIGANTAIFSLFNAVLLRALPIPEPRQLVQLTASGNSWFGYPELARFRSDSRALSSVFGGTSIGRVNIGFRDTAGLAQGDAYTDNFFSVLGLTPERGRFFAPGEDRSDATGVVLSDAYWRRRFAADRSILGQTIALDKVPFTVVGIAPRAFRSLAVGRAPDFWIPLHALDRLKPDPGRWRGVFDSWLLIAGRLAPGVSLRQAEAELDGIQRRVLPGSHLQLRPAETGVTSGLRQNYGLALKLLMAVAAMVLLISSANIASLTMARVSRRRREIAVRLALGSGRARVVRQLLLESLLLATVGGVLALGIAWWGSAALVGMISTGDLPVPLDVQPDWRVFGFTAAISLATGILFGLAPAIRGTRVDPGPALKERALAPTSRLQARLPVVLQVMLSLVLVSGAGLFTRTLENLRNVDVGYQRDNILMFSVDAKLAGYPKERATDVYRDVLSGVSAIPGVESASLSIVRPVDNQYYLTDRVRGVDGRELADRDAINIAWNALSPGYFETIRTPIVLGRDFTLREPRPAVIINESLARRAFGTANPIGHVLDGAQVIGVVKDSRYGGARELPRAVLYRSLFQSAPGMNPADWVGVGAVSFELRCSRGAGLVDEVRHTVARVDRALPVFAVKTLREQTEDSLVRERLLAMLATFFGALALLLACLGLYGLMASLVANRTREIGIRMALGARRREILRLVVSDALWLVAAGIVAGTGFSIALSRYAKSLLFGVGAADPAILALSIAALIAAAALAAFVPARRAARIDPMISLRYE